MLLFFPRRGSCVNTHVLNQTPPSSPLRPASRLPQMHPELWGSVRTPGQVSRTAASGPPGITPADLRAALHPRCSPPPCRVRRGAGTRLPPGGHLQSLRGAPERGAGRGMAGCLRGSEQTDGVPLHHASLSLGGSWCRVTGPLCQPSSSGERLGPYDPLLRVSSPISPTGVFSRGQPGRVWGDPGRRSHRP